ncbi:MAG: tetratricopeptide repeat protein [Betaproteobacteria bacterium]|nr:tetratricopeptide repeat protein [Betaproteobacteria bacterium]
MDRAHIEQVMQQAVGLHQAGHPEQAEPLYRSVLNALPNQPDILHLLGLSLAQQGKHGQALKFFERALKAGPRPDLLSNMGTTLRALKRIPEAVRAYEKALAIDPNFVDALYNLGGTYGELVRLQEAIELLKRAVQLAPDHALALKELAVVLALVWRMDEALGCARRAVELRPGDPAVQRGLALIFQDLGRSEEAVAALDLALKVDPSYADGYASRAASLMALHRLALAERDIDKALSLDPGHVQAHLARAQLLSRSVRYTEAVDEFRRVLELKPANFIAQFNLITTLDLAPNTTFEDHAKECRRWYERHARHLAKAAQPHKNLRDPARRLRIGYVSADFRNHSAATVFRPVIRAHDHGNFEVFLYSGVKQPDEQTREFQARSDHWLSILGMTDEAFVARVREDRIDILVDLSAFTDGSRLMAFAMKPAPIQVTAWGYAVSTGLPAMDYHFADPVAVPMQARQHYTEKIVDLPCLVAYDPPSSAPAEATEPSRSAGFVTYGCLNRAEKMSESTLELWAQVLKARPDSRLLLKAYDFNDPDQRERIRSSLGTRGVDSSRLVFLGGSSQAEHLGALAKVDVVLDPTPHTGGVSTCDALWMGVPVVTLLGNSLPSRLSGAILSALGLSEWIAKTPEEYVDIAVRLGEDEARRASLRRELRPLMRASALVDAERYCRAVEAAYRKMWTDYCGREAGGRAA